jgi:hypothetical protein
MAWSKKHECCVECGTTDRPHKSRGRCEKCRYVAEKQLIVSRSARWVARNRDRSRKTKREWARRNYKRKFSFCVRQCAGPNCHHAFIAETHCKKYCCSQCRSRALRKSVRCQHCGNECDSRAKKCINCEKQVRQHKRLERRHIRLDRKRELYIKNFERDRQKRNRWSREGHWRNRDRRLLGMQSRRKMQRELKMWAQLRHLTKTIQEKLDERAND